MEPAPLQLGLLMILGAILALDQAAIPSLLLSQPLFAGALCGAVLGRFEAGTAAGAVAQMVFMVTLPVGGARLPDTLAAGLAAALAAPADLRLDGVEWLDDPRLAAPVVTAVLAAFGGSLALRAQRRLQQRLARALPAYIESADWKGIERLHESSLMLHVGRGALMALFLGLCAAPVSDGLQSIGVAAPAGRLALALASVSLLRAAGGRRRPVALLVGGVAGLLVAVL